MSERPWRLTRRQRVEMEAALAGLRRDADERAESLASEDRAYDAAVVAGLPELTHPAMVLSRDRSARRAWRTLRARVAIALRAALRADEDARCEEVREREASRWPWASAEGRESAWESADALREWPEMRGPSRYTGVRHSALEGMRAMGLPISPEWETCEAWNRRDVPVYACALALWERA